MFILLTESVSIVFYRWYNFFPSSILQAKNDDALQNNKCRLCGESDETVGLIICEYSKVEEKKY